MPRKKSRAPWGRPSPSNQPSPSNSTMTHRPRWKRVPRSSQSTRRSPAVSLLSLPNELLLEIAGYVPNNRSLNALSKTSLRLWSVANEVLYSRNARCGDSTALLWTVRGGLLDAARFAIERGADVRIKDEFGNSPLAFAVPTGSLEMVRLLLAQGANPNDLNEIGSAPLSLLVQNNPHNMLQWDLKCPFEVKQALLDEKFPLRWECYEPMVRMLLDHGADPNRMDARAATPLHDAVDMKHQNVVKLLLEKGADPNVTNDFLHTPLFNAIYSRHDGIIKLLLEHGADTTLAAGRSDNMLDFAVDYGNKEAVRLLLDHGADPKCISRDGHTAFHLAVQKRDMDLVKIFLDEGVSTETVDKYGDTVLHWAACKGNIRMVKLLLQYDRDPACRELFKKTTPFDNQDMETLNKLLTKKGLSGPRMKKCKWPHHIDYRGRRVRDSRAWRDGEW